MNGIIKAEEEEQKQQQHQHQNNGRKRKPSRTSNKGTTTRSTRSTITNPPKEDSVEASMYIQNQQQKQYVIQNNKISSCSTNPVKNFPKVIPPLTKDRLKQQTVFGLVRGSPYGSCLDNNNDAGSKTSNDDYNDCDKNNDNIKQWREWREKNLTHVHFPVEGFDHIYGTDVIQEDDYGAEAAAMAAYNNNISRCGHDNNIIEDNSEGREYGSIRTPIDAPIGSVKDKWRVLPHFLQVRSLMRQHIDSFDYFVNVEMKEIVQSPSACEIRSEHDPKFYLRYTDCWVGEPSVHEDSYTPTQVTPFQCRLRDCTYSAPIYVNLRYTRGRQIVVKKKVSYTSLF